SSALSMRLDRTHRYSCRRSLCVVTATHRSRLLPPSRLQPPLVSPPRRLGSLPLGTCATRSPSAITRCTSTSTGPTGAKTSLTAWSLLPACGLCCTQSSTISSSKASTSPARKASRRRATPACFVLCLPLLPPTSYLK